MMKKLASSVASVSLVMSLMAPVAHAATLEISGNGAGSNNTIDVELGGKTEVTQKNETLVVTLVHSSASTGGVKVNGNVGTGVDVTTGDATVETSVLVGGSSNVATLPEDCGCATVPESLISGNGNRSTSKIKFEDKKGAKEVKQTNKTAVVTAVAAKAKTGKVEVKKNVGGTKSVLTGVATNTTTVAVELPTNTLNP